MSHERDRMIEDRLEMDFVIVAINKFQAQILGK